MMTISIMYTVYRFERTQVAVLITADGKRTELDPKAAKQLGWKIVKDGGERETEEWPFHTVFVTYSK